MEVDVLFVGGGIAGISGALHLVNLTKRHNSRVEQEKNGQRLEDINIAVLEKGMDIGSHCMSGAIMDPSSLSELIPDFMDKGAPVESDVKKEIFSILTKNRRLTSPIIPPPLNNHGNIIISLSKMTKWLGDIAEQNGVDIFPGFAGTEILFDGKKVAGIRTGDKGIGPDGKRKQNYEPGIDLNAKVTVFSEGTRGSLTKQLIDRLKLEEGKNPQTYALGLKEVWEVPRGVFEPGQVIHTMGYPHKSHTYGGGFVYGMKENMVSLGLLTGLDYEDPFLDTHLEFQRFKLHPFINEIIKEGKLLQYGAKTVPVGGYFSVPRLAFDGGIIAGDSASLFISQKIKGIHIAVKSAMLGAESILGALLKNDFTSNQLGHYETSFYESEAGKELHSVRNFHQAFQKGLRTGLIKSGLQYFLGGRILKERLTAEPDFLHQKKVVDLYGTNFPSDKQKRLIGFDGKITFDKETDVYFSGTTHEEQQPAHLKIPDLNICYTRCAEEYQNPCLRFCPANVYEIVTDEETGKPEMRINFSNCLHCKTCDIKDPYENIQWFPPEGGGGPKYTIM